MWQEQTFLTMLEEVKQYEDIGYWSSDSASYAGASDALDAISFYVTIIVELFSSAASVQVSLLLVL